MDLFSSLFRKGRREGETAHGIIEYKPSGRVLGKNWQPHHLREQTGNNFQCISKIRCSKGWQGQTLQQKPWKTFFCSLPFYAIIILASSFLNVPSWFQLCSYFAINVKKVLDYIFLILEDVSRFLYLCEKKQGSNKQREFGGNFIRWKIAREIFAKEKWIGY